MNSDSDLQKEIEQEFDRLGIDLSTPQGRKEFRETMSWMYKQRKRCDKISLYVVLLILGGVLTSIGTYLKTLISMTK